MNSGDPGAPLPAVTVATRWTPDEALRQAERELADFPERSRAYIRRYFSTQSAMAAIAGDLAFGLET